jgi:hypothetical protein
MKLDPSDPLYDKPKVKKPGRQKNPAEWNPNNPKRKPNSEATLIPITEELVFKLSQSMLTVESMAVICGCSKDHLYNRYGDIIRRGREGRKQRLVETMWEKALVEKDTKMMIWLSKQHLGYKENFNDQQRVSFNIVCSEVPRKIERVENGIVQQIEQVIKDSP